jgi:hypothetical protein
MPIAWKPRRATSKSTDYGPITAEMVVVNTWSQVVTTPERRRLTQGLPTDIERETIAPERAKGRSRQATDGFPVGIIR